MCVCVGGGALLVMKAEPRRLHLVSTVISVQVDQRVLLWFFLPEYQTIVSDAISITGF